MAQPHTLILAGALIVALAWPSLPFSRRFGLQQPRGETLEWLQDHVSRGIQILAKGCGSGEDGYQGGDDHSYSGDAGANPGNLH